MSGNNDSNIIIFPGAPVPGGTLQLRVELLLMPLPVWRRFLVPEDYSFWDLHVAIQDAMGWQDKHLHQFTLDDPVTAKRIRLGIPDQSGFHGDDEVMPCWAYQVTRFMKPGALPALYTYDFGDEWQHEVILEADLPAKRSLKLPHCLGGEGRCPPEDSGGPAGCRDHLQPAWGDEFIPEEVIFDNPRERWDRAFPRD